MSPLEPIIKIAACRISGYGDGYSAVAERDGVEVAVVSKSKNGAIQSLFMLLLFQDQAEKILGLTITNERDDGRSERAIMTGRSGDSRFTASTGASGDAISASGKSEREAVFNLIGLLLETGRLEEVLQLEIIDEPA